MTTKNSTRFNHHKNFPTNPFLCLVIGASGTGKTNLVFNLLTTPEILDYKKLIVYTTQPNIKYYQLLEGFNQGLTKECLSNLLKIFDEGEDKDELNNYDIPNLLNAAATSESNKYPIESHERIKYKLVSNLNYSQIPKNEKTLIIFDDCINEGDQEVQKQVFIHGRGDLIGSIYITQSFKDLDNIIKRNSSCIFMFDLDDYDVTNIHRRFKTNMVLKEFKSFCNNTWNTQYSFVFINPLLPPNRVISSIENDD